MGRVFMTVGGDGRGCTLSSFALRVDGGHGSWRRRAPGGAIWVSCSWMGEDLLQAAP